MNFAQWNPCTARFSKPAWENHLGSQFLLLIDWNLYLDKVCEIVMMLGKFPERSSALCTGDEAIMHGGMTTEAGTRTDFLAWTAEWLTVIIWGSHLEAWRSTRPYSEIQICCRKELFRVLFLCVSSQPGSELWRAVLSLRALRGAGLGPELFNQWLVLQR